MDHARMLTEVLSVACLTEDRAPGEQRAMLDLALIIDLGRGAFMYRNHDLYPPTMVAHVEATYDPGSLSGNRRVSLSKAQREKYNRLLKRWSRCEQCGWPMGIHYGNDHVSNCPRADDEFLPRLRALRATDPDVEPTAVLRDVQDTLPL